MVTYQQLLDLQVLSTEMNMGWVKSWVALGRVGPDFSLSRRLDPISCAENDAKSEG